MKIYLFYLKSEKNTLYAYTKNKEYALYFSAQRNMKLFTFNKVDMDTEEYEDFKNKFWDQNMIKIFLEDDTRSYEIIATNNEEVVLNDACERLSDDLYFYRSYFLNCKSLNKKVIKLIDKLTDISLKNYKIYDEGTGKYDLELQINTFSLFYYLFKNTFVKNGKRG